MKKLLLIALVVFLAAPAMAQEQGDMRINAGINYGVKPFSGDGAAGINAGFEYVFSDGMSGQVGYSKWSNFSILNLNYRYYFMTDGTQVYGSAGLSFTSIDLGNTSGSGNGLNLGIGAIFPVSDAFGINTQVDYEFQKLGTESFGLAVKAGVVYMF